MLKVIASTKDVVLKFIHDCFNIKIDLLFWMKLLIFIDFFSVSLVIPVLASYYKDANLSPTMYGIISSTYSVAQLFGGLVLGFMSDYVSKRSILLFSFLGSGISYFLVGQTKNIMLLFASRVIVGLLKHTMSMVTLVTSELAKSDPNMREKELSQISALTTASFIVGPSIGGLLYKIDTRLPSILSAILFLLNSFICVYIVPDHELLRSKSDSRRSVVPTPRIQLRPGGPSQMALSESVINDQVPPVVSEKSHKNSTTKSNQNTTTTTTATSNDKIVESKEEDTQSQPIQTDSNNKPKPSSLTLKDIISEIKTICMNNILLQTLVLRLLLAFIQASTSSRNLLNYYQNRFSIETYQLGFLSSFYTCVTLFAEVFLVSPILRYIGDSTRTLQLCLGLIIITNIIESHTSDIYSFLIVVAAPAALAGTLVSSSARTLFLNSVPSEHLGKILSIFNAMLSGIFIVSPIFGSRVFSYFEVDQNSHLKGYITAVHFSLLLGLSLIFSHFLGTKKVQVDVTDDKKKL